MVGKLFLIKEFRTDPNAIWRSYYCIKKEKMKNFNLGLLEINVGFDNERRITSTNDKP